MTPVNEVWIVLGEYGEYSDREVWVSGVFLTEADAQAKVEERLAVNRVHAEWQRRYDRLLYAHPFYDKPFNERVGNFEDEFKAVRLEIEAKLEPEPEYEQAEQCSIHKVRIGSWRSGPNEGEGL